MCVLKEENLGERYGAVLFPCSRSLEDKTATSLYKTVLAADSLLQFCELVSLGNLLEYK